MKGQQSQTKVVRVQARTLRIHPSAQRLLVASKLKQVAKDLDLDAIGVLHGVEYEINGERAIWLIDGQHRHRVLMDEGLGDWIVEVKVHLDVTDDARASELFLKLNNRTAIHPFDKFENARAAGHPDAVGITEIARQFDLTINRRSDDGLLCCVTVLERVFHFDGNGAVLGLALETLTAAWGRTASAVEGKLVEGLGMLYQHFNGAIDRPVLVKKLAKYPGGPSALIGDARGLRDLRHATIARCVAEQVVATYNAGRRVERLEAF
jgi:hypothetical protein